MWKRRKGVRKQQKTSPFLKGRLICTVRAACSAWGEQCEMAMWWCVHFSLPFTWLTFEAFPRRQNNNFSGSFRNGSFLASG